MSAERGREARQRGALAARTGKSRAWVEQDYPYCKCKAKRCSHRRPPYELGTATCRFYWFEGYDRVPLFGGAA